MRVAPWILPLFLGMGCQGRSVTPPGSEGPRLPYPVLKKLTQQRIFFGHQSVGQNIVQGLEALSNEQPDIRFRIVEARSPGSIAGPAFIHGQNGHNGQPLTKIDGFVDALQSGGAGTDIAFFKFCYVDFPPGTDVDGLFAEYKKAMARLRATYPRVKFVHVTSPLTVVQSGPKALAKRILGRRLAGTDENVLRHRFNTLMRNEYAGREPLFDLAAVEATRPDGRIASFSESGKTFPALAPEYASDGRHLNPLGSRLLAGHLLRTLADVLE